MKVVYLEPKSSFIGERIKSSFIGERIHSDTLFGAICWGIRQVYDKETLEDILRKFKKGEPPFLLSSTYPHINKNGRKTHFLPKLITKPLRKEIDSKKTLEVLKRFKNFTLLPEELFNKCINGELSDENFFEGVKIEKLPYIMAYTLDEKEYVQSGSVLIESGSRQYILKTTDVQRNAINRLTNSTEGKLFYDTETFLSQNVGLYFLMKTFDNNENIIKGALNFLQDRGIGGDISTGKGCFKISPISDFNGINEPDNADAYTTLSLYYPTSNEISYFKEQEDRLWCSIVRRRGKIESAFVSVENIWKDSVRMFSEGSTFPIINDHEIYGCNPIIKQRPFDVQQYGYAFSIKMKRNKNEIQN